YYPFKYGKKFFYRFTDLSSGNKISIFRPYIRFFELIFGLTKTFISIVRQKPRIINYSLIQTFLPEIIFLKAIRRFTKAKLIITCHDVIPFSNKYITHEQCVRMRKTAFDLADYLLIHNSNSALDLQNYYDINQNKIIYHSFPLMDISKLYPCEFNNEYKSDFLFIGHMREEKGIFLLIDAWKKFQKNNKEAKLIIAGSNPNNYDFSELKNCNVTLKIGFLSDIDYCQLIRSTKYVILPYLRGTNSGVVSTVLGLGKIPICSDIPMFKNNPLISERLLFHNESVDSLVEKMNEMVNEGINLNIDSIITDYKNNFENEVIKTYNKILLSCI
ncbi:MAG: glycosyltransferase, partial [Muribaculum sp.]|nr:glycosyltransferase [Muribaculum sp.]